MNNYYIAIFNRKGEEVNIGLCSTWYGISEEMMRGLCVGIFHGYGRSTAEVRVYELDGNGNKGKLIRVQN